MLHSKWESLQTEEINYNPNLREQSWFWDYIKVSASIVKISSNVTNKQLLDEGEHDIMNYQSRGLCYLPKPKAEADNTDTRVW